jgi:hypothetical protein
VDGHSELTGSPLEEAADVGRRSEPQLPPMREPGGESIGHDEVDTAKTGGYRSGLVEQRPRVENLDDPRTWPADRGGYRSAGPGKELGQLPTAAALRGLEEPPERVTPVPRSRRGRVGPSADVVMSASLPLSCGRRSGRAFGASVPLDRLAEATPDPSIGSP